MTTKENNKKRLPAGYKERSDGRIEARFAIEGKRYSVWKNRRTGTVKKSTEYRRDEQFKRISKELGKRKIAVLERRELVAFQKKLLLSLTTTGVNQTMDLLRGILESAKIDRIIAWNPCDGIKNLQRTEVAASETIHRALTQDETELFFLYAKKSWYYEYFALLLQTGLRCGEASALTWKDIDYAHNMIHVTKTIMRTGDSQFEIGTPKTKSSKRSVPMTEAAKDILKQQRKKSELFSNGRVVSIDARIFTATDGHGYVLTHNVSTILKSIIKRVNADGEHLNVFSTHAFRATFATRAIEAGMSPQTLKTILGHSSFKMTMDLYSHVMDEVKQDEIKKLNIAN